MIIYAALSTMIPSAVRVLRGTLEERSQSICKSDITSMFALFGSPKASAPFHRRSMVDRPPGTRHRYLLKHQNSLMSRFQVEILSLMKNRNRNGTPSRYREEEPVKMKVLWRRGSLREMFGNLYCISVANFVQSFRGGVKKLSFTKRSSKKAPLSMQYPLSFICQILYGS